MRPADPGFRRSVARIRRRRIPVAPEALDSEIQDLSTTARSARRTFLRGWPRTGVARIRRIRAGWDLSTTTAKPDGPSHRDPNRPGKSL